MGRNVGNCLTLCKVPEFKNGLHKNSSHVSGLILRHGQYVLMLPL